MPLACDCPHNPGCRIRLLCGGTQNIKINKKVKMLIDALGRQLSQAVATVA